MRQTNAPNRPTFPPMLLPLAATLLVALFAPAARAQAPAASPAPGAEAQVLTAGDFEIIGALEFGARGLDLTGSREKYFSDQNYRAGFRVFETSFLARSRAARRTLFDTLLVTTQGWDADPYGTVRANVEKDRWYKFDANFRRNSYNYDVSCCNASQIRGFNTVTRAAYPDLGRTNHWARVKHKIGDFDLRLLPANRNLRFNLGYSMDRFRGPGGTSLNYARDDFSLRLDPWRSRSDEWRGGFESRVGKLDLNFTQGFRAYRDDTTVVSGLNTGNNPNNFTSLNSYLLQAPSRGRAWYSRLSAHTQLADRFDLTARYIYTKSTTRFSTVEQITGQGNIENANAFIDLNRVTARGEDVERPTHLLDVGFTWSATRRLRVSDTFRHNQFRIDGGLAYTDLRLLRRSGAGAPLPSPIVINLNPTRELDVRRWQNNLEADYDFGPRFSFFVGHRFIHRRQESRARGRVYPLNLTGPAGSFPADAAAFFHDEEAENTTNGFFGGFKAKPTQNLSIHFDANRGQSDNAFTRVDNYDTVSFRVRSRWTPRRGVTVNASFITRDNNNPGVADEALLGVPEFDVDISSRTFSSSLDWSPGSRFFLNAGYTYQHLTSDIGIIFNPGATAPAGLGRSQYFLRDHFFFASASATAHTRLTLFAAYRGHRDRGQGDRLTNDAAGLFIRSFPLRAQSPEARLVFRLHSRVDWTAGYQYFDYKDYLNGRFPDLFVNQNYHAHLPYASLRFYFGRRE